jgi:hypothetical protein
MSTTDEANSTAQRLMSRHLMEVYNERDVVRRAAAMAELYSDEITFYEPADSTTGHAGWAQRSSSFSTERPDGCSVPPATSW